jgi:propionate CoA-transferase
VIEKEGKHRSWSEAVEQVSSPANAPVAQGQDITYVTERCVMKLDGGRAVVTEIAPGVDLQRDVLDQAEFAAEGLARR